MLSPGDSIVLCSQHELDARGYVTRWVEALRDELTAVRSGGKLQVYSTLCPHAAGELACDTRRGELRCRWHAARFSLDSGRAISPAGLPSLRRYEAEERDGHIRVRVP